MTIPGPRRRCGHGPGAAGPAVAAAWKARTSPVRIRSASLTRTAPARSRRRRRRRRAPRRRSPTRRRRRWPAEVGGHGGPARSAGRGLRPGAGRRISWSTVIMTRPCRWANSTSWGPRHHGPVVVDQLAQHSGRRLAGQGGRVDGGFGVARPLQGRRRPWPQRNTCPAAGSRNGLRRRVDKGPVGGRPVGGRDTGGVPARSRPRR